MKKRLTRNIEWTILICTILLVIIGLFAIYSATENYNHEEFYKQLVWIGVAIPFTIAFILIDYDWITKVSPILYGLIILALIAVLFTEPISGATSWFTFGPVSIQPSEFAKFILVLFEALLISRMKKKGEDEISRPTRVAILILALLVPLALILKQPDYGTAMAFIFAFIFMLFTGGIKKRYLVIGALVVAIVLPLIYFFVMPSYTKERIAVFLIFRVFFLVL